MALNAVKKLNYDYYPITIDFDNWLGSAETIASSSVSAANTSLNSSDCTANIIAATSVSGTVLTVVLSSGIHGYNYMLQYHITTSAGNKFAEYQTLQIRD